MIQGIPSSEDFINAGKAQLDFAWDIVISLFMQCDEADDYDLDLSEEKEEFWEAAKQRIQTALAITQQGVELIIKGKITEISPYLLISGHPSDWPKFNPQKQVNFSDFRTIDAQDLVKTHNLFSEKKLSLEFIENFNYLRKLRNRVIHTVDKNLKIPAIEVINQILEMHNFLIPDKNWVQTRHDFLVESPQSMLYSSDGTEALVAWEFLIVFSLLDASKVEKYFGINKRQRKYICPSCEHLSRDYTMVKPRYAVLRPNTAQSTTLYCFVCRDIQPVRRDKCMHNDCRGNVISTEYDECCTCGHFKD